MENSNNMIEEFSAEEKACRIMLSSFKEIIPNKKNWLAFVVSIIISLATSILMGFEENTVDHFKNVIGKFLDIELAILGCIIAVYSIMIAFFNDDFMKCLLQAKEKEKSILKKYVSYYESALYLYFIGLCMSGICFLVMSFLTNDFNLTENLVLNCVLASILIFVYMLYSVRILYELKSLIYNTIMLFRASIVQKFK